MKKNGFTLIEVIIYTALVTGVIALTLLATYRIIDSDKRITERRELATNQNFLAGKIFWVLQSVDAINSPVSGASGASLSINKLGYAYNPLVLSLNNGRVELASGATTTQLTNKYVTVSNLNFAHYNFSGTSAVRVTANLSNDTGSTTIDTTIFVK